MGATVSKVRELGEPSELVEFPFRKDGKDCVPCLQEAFGVYLQIIIQRWIKSSKKLTYCKQRDQVDRVRDSRWPEITSEHKSKGTLSKRDPRKESAAAMG